MKISHDISTHTIVIEYQGKVYVYDDTIFTVRAAQIAAQKEG